MANDRMWLVHKPSGKMALIAKNWDDVTWDFYTGQRLAPHQYDIKGLLDECGYDTEYFIEYDSK
jgi:hypothetical protein